MNSHCDIHQDSGPTPSRARRGIPLLPTILTVGILCLVGCKSPGDAILDTKAAAPLLSSASITPAVINTDTINVGAERTPEDILPLQCVVRARVSSALTEDEVAAVTAVLSTPDGGGTLGRLELLDNGADPDSLAGDSLFTGVLSFQIDRTSIGTFTVEVGAQSSMDFSSNTMRLPLSIVRLNQAPMLSQLVIPDSLNLGTETQSFLIQVKVTDPDGLVDVRRVFFNTYKPDGSPSSGNPFPLYDDGSEQVLVPPDLTSGDPVKGDGVYSLNVYLDPTNQKGVYRFVFQASDRSGALSATLTHYLTVW